MAVRRMDIFGDDSTEDVETGDIFYHSSTERSNVFSTERSESDDKHSDFAKQPERNTRTSSTKNVERVYDYGGRHKFTGELYEEVPDEYEDSHRKEFEQSRSKMRDSERERKFGNRHSYEWERKRCFPGLPEIASTVSSTAVRKGGWKLPDSRFTGIIPCALYAGFSFCILSAGIKVAILVPVPTMRPMYAS